MPTTPSYVCDTVPAPRFGPLQSSSEHSMSSDDNSVQPPPRKLCIRHQRMADEGTNLKLQQSLDALPFQEREAVSAIWSNFSSSSHPRRALILQGLLTMCCFSQLSLLTDQLAHLIRIDPFTVLPREVGLKVLGYLDATSLCRAAQVSKQWRGLADDDILWRGICEQHIGQKCHKCGWGLPVLKKKHTLRLDHPPPCSSTSFSKKRDFPPTLCSPQRLRKRQRAEPFEEPYPNESHASVASTSFLTEPSTDPLLDLKSSPLQSLTRPWKDVYSERLSIERNWRRGRCTVRTLKGHTDGVMCLQFSETLSHPTYPILMTGSYDRTARVWNLETGEQLQCLKGHTRTVRSLQFDEVKLITASMDHTIRVWDWRRGKCICTLEGHTAGVVSLNFDSNVLASGSVDMTVKVWNLRTREAFTLRGHSDWVNAVQLWDSNPGRRLSSDASEFDLLSLDPSSHPVNAAPQIDPGKMLFSASDDGSIRLWDLTLRTCVRQFSGHVAQVQSMRLLVVDDQTNDPSQPCSPLASSEPTQSLQGYESLATPPPVCFTLPIDRTVLTKQPTPVLISGSLDNTIKLWDIDTGKAVRTLFGHIEGVWAVASDKLRLVSGSHDRTIKVWNREDGRCTATLVGHCGAVTSLQLGEDKIVSGSDDGDVKVWSFND